MTADTLPRPRAALAAGLLLALAAALAPRARCAPPAAADVVAALLAAPVGRFEIPAELPDWRELRSAALAWRPDSSPPLDAWIRDTLSGLDGAVRHFHYRLPATYDPATPAPLWLHLHGGVSRAAPPDSGDGDWPEVFTARWASDRGMIVVVPAAQTGAAWWDEVGARGLLEILRRLKSRLAVDHERVHATGFSDGGSGCWFLAQFHPSDFAAFLPQCGHPGCDDWGDPPRQASFANLRNRPVYAVSNGLDRLYPAAEIRGYLEPAWAAGADLRWFDHPGYGHGPDYWERGEEQERMGAFLDRTARDPLRARLTLEGADPARCDWLEIVSVGAGGAFPGERTDWNARTVDDRVVVGFLPDAEYAGGGCRVEGVVDDPDAPAARIGLRAGGRRLVHERARARRPAAGARRPLQSAAARLAAGPRPADAARRSRARRQRLRPRRLGAGRGRAAPRSGADRLRARGRRAPRGPRDPAPADGAGSAAAAGRARPRPRPDAARRRPARDRPRAGADMVSAGASRGRPVEVARAAAAAVLALLAGPAAAACLLADPSFEIAGEAGALSPGWSTFGAVEASGAAAHGRRAARLRGMAGGGGLISGCVQQLPCAPGETWSVSLAVRPSVAQPLAGASACVARVEWLDAAGAWLGAAEAVLADAAALPGEYAATAATAGPAPAAAATARLSLALRQDPALPPPVVEIDAAGFGGDAAPTVDDVQWTDFPGGRELDFAGRVWRVKGPGWYGPGGNWFDDGPESVRVDESGRLHLAIRQDGGLWSCAEVALAEALGYGDHVFATVGALEQLDPRAVLGLFLWQYQPCYESADAWWNPCDEIDVELSRWGDPGNAVGQFVAQPWDWAGNLERWDAAFDPLEPTCFAFRWLPDRVEFRAWRGGPDEEAPETALAAWTYLGPHVPRPEQPRVHVNLWLTGAPAAAQDVVLADFVFTPFEDGLPAAPPGLRPRRSGLALAPPVPNPCNPSATLRFELARAGNVELAVHDLAGRRVRTLLAGPRAAGAHAVAWDGRDGEGRPVASGLYFCTLRGGGELAVRRLLLLR